MSLEGQVRDQKSLRTVTGRAADFHGLAKDCVCLANAQGGHIAVGIEDGAGWLERLLNWEVVRQTGRTKGTRYFIDPGMLRTLRFPSQT